MADTRTLDCRGLACPEPVVRTKEALQAATGTLRVFVNDEGACANVRRFAESQGARVSVSEASGALQLTIEPGAGPSTGKTPSTVCGDGSAGRIAVLVSSEGMGRGDEALGRILMAAFLDTLGQFKGEVSHAIFLNTGARLAAEGSPVLDQLRQLEQLGVRILVCGTCLNHFGIKDRLAVGSVSNMYAIIEALSGAGRILQP